MISAVVLGGSTSQIKICFKLIPLLFFRQIKPDGKSVNIFLVLGSAMQNGAGIYAARKIQAEGFVRDKLSSNGLFNFPINNLRRLFKRLFLIMALSRYCPWPKKVLFYPYPRWRKRKCR